MVELPWWRRVRRTSHIVVCAALTLAIVSTGMWVESTSGHTAQAQTPGAVQQVAVGFGHTCAVLGTGQVSCWGNGSSGQLGTGGTTDSSTPSAPVALPGIATATAVAVGFSHTCALLDTGQVSCWGADVNGEVGDGSGPANVTTPSPPIALPVGTHATQIAAGSNHTCALLDTGQISCWGNGSYGELGTGAVNDVNSPSAVIALPGGQTAVAISAGGFTTCAVLSTGQVSCWGAGEAGQLGTGAMSNSPSPTAPIALPAGTTATAIAVGSASTCALLNTRQISCWGNNVGGQLGTGNNVDLASPSAPITLPGGATASAIAAGIGAACALLDTGQISCWGQNDDGQLGFGNRDRTSTPSPPISLPNASTATAIAAAGYHVCAVLATGQLTCWGSNFAGQLGTGNLVEALAPALSGVPSVQIAATSGNPNPTSTAPVTFTITFDQAVSGFSAAGVSIAGTAGATMATITGGPSVYTATITQPPNDGTITATVVAGAATSVLGSTNAAAAAPAAIGFDTTGPAASINLADGQPSTTSSTPIVFSVTFNEPVTGFDLADLVIAGTAGANTGTIAGSGANYTVTIQTVARNGTVTVAIAPGGFSDALGNVSTTASLAAQVTIVDDSQNRLPATGNHDSVPILVAALLATLVGGALVAFGRQRRAARP